MKTTLKILGIILGILVIGGVIYSKTLYNYYDENTEMSKNCYDLAYTQSSSPFSVFYKMHTGSYMRVCNQFSNCVTKKKMVNFIAPKTEVSDEILTPIVQDCMSKALKEEQGY